MTMTKDAAATKAALDDRRARLAELQAELDQIPDTIARHREALGRSLAAGEGEASREAARHEVETLEAHREELTAAVKILTGEIEALEAEWRPLHVAELDAEADQLRDAHFEALAEARNHVLAALEELEPLVRRVGTTWQEALAARRRAMKAAGAENQDILHAKVWPGGYQEMSGRGSGELHYRLAQIRREMEALANYAHES